MPECNEEKRRIAKSAMGFAKNAKKYIAFSIVREEKNATKTQRK
jgi:hypothetical protein